MDNELALVWHVTYAHWFRESVMEAFAHRLHSPWEDRLACLLDVLMERGGLEGYEHPERGRTIIAWPHGSRRKHPAFIAIHAGKHTMFDAVRRMTWPTCTIEVVEAGKHGVAGQSPVTDLRAEA